MKTDLKRENFSAEGMRFAIVVARWNHELTSKLADGAVDALIESGASIENIYPIDVPGAFELPVLCLRAAEMRTFDAVIALGVVIRGDTPHFEYVAGQAAAGIMRASMDTGVPIMFGVITVDTLEQALARTGEKADNKGYEAAMSAIETVHSLRTLNEAFPVIF